MKLYNIVRWKNKYVSSDVPVMKSYIFFDFIEICRHFKGFQDNGFRIELLTKRHWFGFGFKRGFEKWLNIFTALKKEHWKLVFRFNKPIISFGIIDIKNHFRNVELV